MTPQLNRARMLVGLGISVIPVAPRSKQPDGSVLPLGPDGTPTWSPFQERHPTDAELVSWFGHGVARNLGIVLGEVSGLVGVEGDTPEAVARIRQHMPNTPWRTTSARGEHSLFKRAGRFPWPPTITIQGHQIEIKRDRQYLVGPGSIHPSGHVYTEVEPWTHTLDEVPELAPEKLPREVVDQLLGRTTATKTEPLPDRLGEGGRNSTLFREGCRLRRLGLEETEILAALQAINQRRCQPPLDTREVASIARSCARYAPAADEFELSEAGDAECFAHLNADSLRFDHLRGRWLLFDGYRWAPQTHGEVDRLTLECSRARQRAAINRDKDRKKWAVAGEARRRLVNMRELAKSVAPLADDGLHWDEDPMLLGVTNGVVDLRTGHLRAGRPEDRITKQVRAAYDPSARCPLWDRTLDEIFQGDAALLAYVDRFTGYSLTGDCREECFAIAYGDGANGKGTYMNTIAWLLADYADDLPSSALTQQGFGPGIPNDIAKIVGKRFVTASETAETVRLNEARVKALTGRDPITARFLHQEFFTFQPVAKIMLATNHQPEVRDTSEGLWRRIHVIPFAASFIGREDRTLKDRLRDELPGILARAIRGCLAWQREGLNPPAIVRDATSEYRATSMPLTRFLDECCVVQDGARANFGQLFRAYVKWCGTTREARLTRPQFNEALYAKFQVDPNERRHVVFLGVGVLDLYAGEDL